MENKIINSYREDGNTNGPPGDIFPYIKEFCNKIVPTEQPIFVIVKPETVARMGECFENVNEIIKTKGGSRVLGWRIWEWYGIMVEAELHAVWLSPNGEIIDITPNALSISRILFIPDPDIVSSDKQVDNIRQSLIKENPKLDKLIQIYQEIFNLQNAGDRSEQQIVELSDEESSRYQRMIVDSVNLCQSISKSIPGRNDLCRCGSGKKYKKCCGK